MDNFGMNNPQMSDGSFVDMMNMSSSQVNWGDTQDYKLIGEQVTMSTQNIAASDFLKYIR